MTGKERSIVYFRPFLKDQVELYPFSPDEAALVELIANSLDAGSSRMDINITKEGRIFELVDNGSGMTRKGFREYHNFAKSLKVRGGGIGFAGLGAKLGLWISRKVETETRSNRFTGCSEWFFEGDELFWQKRPERTLGQNGTRTIFHLRPDRKMLLQDAEVKRIIKRHYWPLFDPFLSRIYVQSLIYPKPVEFYINGNMVTFVEPGSAVDASQREEFQVTMGKRKRPAGIGYFLLARNEFPEEQCGIGISTYGKMITREWFGKFPSDMQRISGLVEVPALASILTTTKCDFLKYGVEGQRYYKFRREMQKKFGDWLQKVGKTEKKPETPKESAELEKLIRSILGRLPELATVFASLSRQDVALPDKEGADNAETVSGSQPMPGAESGEGGGEGVPVYPGEEETPALRLKEDGPQPATTLRRSIPLGPKVGWLEEPGNPRLSRIDANTIVINSGHPAYHKAEGSGHKRYHELLAIAMALVEEKAPETPADTLELLARFFSAWGAV